MPTLRLLTTVGLGVAGHGGEVYACAYTSDGALVLSGGWDGYLRLWETEQGTQVAAVQVARKPISACAVTPDDKQWLAGSLEGLLGTWDASTHREIRVFLAHPRPISTITFSQDGATVATASWDCNVILWDRQLEHGGRTLAGHSDIVAGCCFTPDGTRLLSWSHDATACLWDVASGRRLHQLRGHGDRINVGAISPDGRWAATADQDGGVKLWDLTAPMEIAGAPLAAPARGCWFLLDAATLILADAKGTLALFGVPDLKQQSELATQLSVNCGALSPAGSQIALGCTDGRVRLVAIDGFDSLPLVATAWQSTRRTQTRFQRLLGKSTLLQTHVCCCPVCRQRFEVSDVSPSSTVVCTQCQRKLRIGVIFPPR